MAQAHASASSTSWVVGVDVGTSSARAGVIEIATGRMIASHSHPILIFHPQPNFYQHSSADIWQAVCTAVTSALHLAQQRQPSFDFAKVRGIAFDATCSLVVLGKRDAPVSVSPGGEPEQNVIVWMDHRAEAEAAEINSSHHEVLRYVGGQVSVEMEIPKLAWLKRHLPDSFNTATRFFDLCDFLSYKATGRDVRSVCAVTCKWNFLAHLHSEQSRAQRSATTAPSDPADYDHGWSKSFFEQIGLGELVTEKFTRLGEGFFCQDIGSSIGDGLTAKAAAELGLPPGTAVGVGIIDAHAGGIGVLGGTSSSDKADSGSTASLSGRLAMICGTSTCHMAVTEEAAFVPGVWGPYYSAMVPGLWLLEGGQSAVGSLLDYVIDSHAVGPSLRKRAAEQGQSVHDLLYAQLQRMQKQQGLSSFHFLTSSAHVLPYHHGNRSPRADSSLLGCHSGLTLSHTDDALALLYLGTLQALCYADRHIVSTLSAQSTPIHSVILCGGLSRAAVFQQCEADVLQGVEVLVVDGGVDAMLLGSAMIAAAACGEWGGLRGAMQGMACKVTRVQGSEQDSDVQRFHQRKYAVFLQMHEDQLRYRRIMAEAQNSKASDTSK